MSEQISGRYFAAGASASVAANLRNEGDTVSIRQIDSGVVLSLTVHDISHRLASVPRKITFADRSVFESDNNDGIDAMFGMGGGFVARLARAETSFRLVAVLVVCTMVLLVGLYRYGLPALANGAARMTPASALILMDKGTLPTVDRLLFDASKLSPARQGEVSGLFDELVTQSGQMHPPLRLVFRKSVLLGANAIALPGGTIIITDDLIAAAHSDDEIAGVLAHEIGHVEYRHSAREIYRVLGLGFLLSVIGGDSGQLVEDVIAQAAAIDSLSYSRKFETEADFRSAELMSAIDRDPFAFIDLLARLTGDTENKSETESDMGWLSTHPSTFDRRSTVEKYLAGQKDAR